MRGIRTSLIKASLERVRGWRGDYDLAPLGRDPFGVTLQSQSKPASRFFCFETSLIKASFERVVSKQKTNRLLAVGLL